MADDDLADFYVHTVTVETFLGTNGYGEDTFADGVILSPSTKNGVFLDETRRLVRSSTGEQVVSESRFYTYPGTKALFAPNSRVTIDGVQSRVIKATVLTSGDFDLPDHIVVNLT